MNRRDFLKLIGIGIVGHELDIEKLLWVPGQKKIFLPSPGLPLTEIIATELERIVPKIRDLFERDDLFYAIIKKQEMLTMRNRQMQVPIEIQPVFTDKKVH